LSSPSQAEAWYCFWCLNENKRERPHEEIIDQ
jgi:hypothetical protein